LHCDEGPVVALTGPTVRAKRPRKPKCTPTLREEVFVRDKACVGYLMDHRHICRNLAGSHSPYALEKMTLEHVKDELQAGLRAPSDRKHCVTACVGLNLQPPTKEQREWMREYLARVEE
jgi:hypothetical protein